MFRAAWKAIKSFFVTLANELGYTCCVMFGIPVVLPRHRTRVVPELTDPPPGHPERVDAQAPSETERLLWAQLGERPR